MHRLDYQSLFEKGARAPPLNSFFGEGRQDTRERRKSSLYYACNLLQVYMSRNYENEVKI